MALLSKDQILGADDRKYETVAVPEWGGEVRMRSLTGADRDEYENSLVQQVGNKTVSNARNARAKLIALCAVDETGTPLFTKADVIKLGSKNSGALQRLFDVAARMNGFTEDDMAALEGNSEPAPSGPSTSVSPSPSDALSPSSSPAPAPASSPNGWPTNGGTAPSAQPAPTITPR